MTGRERGERVPAVTAPFTLPLNRRERTPPPTPMVRRSTSRGVCTPRSSWPSQTILPPTRRR